MLVPQDVDYPALNLDVDRARAATLGLSSKEVIQNIITALTSGAMIAPSYYIDPKTVRDTANLKAKYDVIVFGPGGNAGVVEGTPMCTWAAEVW